MAQVIEVEMIVVMLWLDVKFLGTLATIIHKQLLFSLAFMCWLPWKRDSNLYVHAGSKPEHSCIVYRTCAQNENNEDLIADLERAAESLWLDNALEDCLGERLHNEGLNMNKTLDNEDS